MRVTSDVPIFTRLVLVLVVIVVVVAMLRGVVLSSLVIDLWLLVADDALVVLSFVSRVQVQMSLLTQMLITIVFFLVILVKVLQVMIMAVMDVASDLVLFLWVHH